MTEFKLKDSARIKVRETILRKQEQLLWILATQGPKRGVELRRFMGYKSAGGVYLLIHTLLAEGKIVRRGDLYSLASTSPEPEAKVQSFFEGSTKKHALRNWLRKHQDEPITQNDAGRGAGYSSLSQGSSEVNSMLRSGILRRYQAPEDRFGLWRYQYVDPSLAGIKVTKPEEDKPEEDKPEEEARAEESPLSLASSIEDEPEPQQPIVAEPAIAIVERYAKEFFWQTSSLDIKEFVKWVKEQPNDNIS